MHDKPLLKSAGELLRRRHGSSRTSVTEPDRFGVDMPLVGGFLSGTLTPDEEARLADEVAELLPHRWDLPNRTVERLTPLIDHLGGQKELMVWLDRHPGLPRHMARIYVLMGNLDRYSDDPAVLDAVRRARAQTPYPEGLREHLTPATTDATLTGLGSAIEGLLSDGREDDATALALATADWLRGAVRDTENPGAELREVGELMDHLYRDIRESGARS